MNHENGRSALFQLRYRNLLVVALMLVCLAIVLFMGDWKEASKKKLEE